MKTYETSIVHDNQQGQGAAMYTATTHKPTRTCTVRPIKIIAPLAAALTVSPAFPANYCSTPSSYHYESGPRLVCSIPAAIMATWADHSGEAIFAGRLDVLITVPRGGGPRAIADLRWTTGRSVYTSDDDWGALWWNIANVESFIGELGVNPGEGQWSSPLAPGRVEVNKNLSECLSSSNFTVNTTTSGGLTYDFKKRQATGKGTVDIKMVGSGCSIKLKTK